MTVPAPDLMPNSVFEPVVSQINTAFEYAAEKLERIDPVEEELKYAFACAALACVFPAWTALHIALRAASKIERQVRQ